MNIFDYTSGKIKLVAKIYFWVMSSLTTLVLFIGFIIGLANRSAVIALVCIFGIPVSVFVFWWTGLLIYGFGRLIDNTDEIRCRLEERDKGMY